MLRVRVAVLTLLACCSPDVENVDPATSSGTDTEDTPTGDPACQSYLADCPRLGDCEADDCVAGECVYGPEPVDDDYFDDIEPEGPSGDCKRTQCTPQGELVEVDDDDDGPIDDNACTRGECQPEPHQTPLAPNSECGGGFDSAPSYCHPDTTCHLCEYVPPESCDPVDGGEDNETQATASSLGTVDDADLFEKYARCATLGSPADVDWFEFHGVDELLGTIDPQRTLYTLESVGRLCVFFDCDSGSTTVTCSSGEPAVAPDGQPGCCGPGTVVPILTCGDFFNYSADVWLRVDQGPDACTPYELRYNF